MSSNMTAGQWVGAIVGAVAGFFTGGSTWYYTAAAMASGASTGMAIGGAIDPPKGPHMVGPRINDLSQQTSTYGAPIPRVYGTTALMGNVFWLENNRLKEVAHDEGGGGKGGGGGPTTTTYEYYATFAVGICRGPIYGVRRIWAGANLLYDAGSDDYGTIVESNRFATQFTLHDGSEDQLPDERMQATLGVANTPAYRGLAYIVIRDMSLKDHGNTLIGAPIKVEVVAQGDISAGYSYQPMAYGGSRAIAVGNGTTVAGIFDFTVDPTAIGNAVSDGGSPWRYIKRPSDVYGFGFVSIAFGVGWFVAGTPFGIHVSPDGLRWTRVLDLQYAPYYSVQSIHYVNGQFVLLWSDSSIWVGGAPSIAQADGLLGPINTTVQDWTNIATPISGNNITWNGSVYCMTGVSGTVCTSPDLLAWTSHSVPIGNKYSIASLGGLFVLLDSIGDNDYVTSPDGATWTARTMPTVGAWALKSSGGKLCAVTGGSVYFSTDGINWSAPTTITPSHTFWTMAESDGAFYLCQSGAGSPSGDIFKIWPKISSVNPILGDIVEAECLSSRLIDAGDIDTIALTQEVRGYRVANVGAIRSAIEPIQGAFPFDIVQAGYQIKFKPRGGTSVATVQAVDLDARADGENPGVSISVTREMDSVLPCRVTLKYLDVNREGDIGEQYFERLNTAAINVVALDLSLVMNATEAIGTAEVLIYLYWLERYDLSFRLPPTYGHLEPADVITVNAADTTYECRLTAINYLPDGRLECSAKYNSSAVYTQMASGEEGLSTGRPIDARGNTNFELLDIPLLIDSTDTAGFAVAASGTASGWPGATLNRSADGSTWTSLLGIAPPGAVMGYGVNAIGSGRLHLIDTASALTVNLFSGDLSSVTEAQMLAGANHFAYGIDGRWEIIAARTCTLQVDGSYLLTDLMRGRFGSEHNAGNHEAMDRVVLLNTSSLNWINSSLNALGIWHMYKCPTSGQSLDDVAASGFAYRAVNLMPLSPAYLNGNRHPTTNDWALTWIRRTRVGGEWRDLVDVPLGETSEAYEVEIYSSATYTTLKRTITGLSTSAAAYTSAQQVTDFGSNQSTLYVKIYQLSGTVGRGFPLTTSITR